MNLMRRLYTNEGIPELTFHHKGFKTRKGERNTKERFKLLNVTKDKLKGKTLLDLNCNYGAMLLYARQLGAGKIIGYDNEVEKVKFCSELFKRLKYTNYIFVQKTAEEIETLDYADIIFYFQPDKGLKNGKKLIKLISESEVNTVYYESKNKERIPIPGYECTMVGKSNNYYNYICKVKL